MAQPGEMKKKADAALSAPTTHDETTNFTLPAHLKYKARDTTCMSERVFVCGLAALRATL